MRFLLRHGVASTLIWFAAATAHATETPSADAILHCATQTLRCQIDPETATWSVEHLPSGCRTSQIRPQLDIAGVTVDFAKCRVDEARITRINDKLGSFQVVRLRYRAPAGLDITYTLRIRQQTSDLIASLSFVNKTGRDLVVRALRPMVVESVVLGGDTSRWMAIGDGRTFSEPYRNFVVATMGEQRFWWYAAVKNLDSGHSVLLGNLTNNKGIGRFTCASGDAHSMKMTAWCDYESIVMPMGATISGEKVLLNFGNSGIDSLKRFGTLIAQEHTIDLRHRNPIDVDDPTTSALFNTWNSWGASVVKGVKYSHRPQFHRAHEDAEWRQKCQRIFAEFGLWQYIHPELPAGKRPTAGKTPLVRRFGRPDWWFPEAQRIHASHPDFYIDGRIDFSNPQVLKFERDRATAFFHAHPNVLISYGADFTSNWKKLPGQHDPFVTSVEAFRSCMKIWRDLARQHPGGCYSQVCMNDIGFCYDVWDILRIGGDSDQGYYGNGLTFTANLVRQASGRFFYNGNVWWNNPDSFHVYAQGMYSFAQAKVHASFCAIAGNRMMPAEPFCDQDTPEDRLDIIRRVLPTTADVAKPVDLFEHNPARLWNMPVERPFGCWNIVGLFNYDENHDGSRVTQDIPFADLGLSSKKEYLVYEFWQQKFLGVLQGGFPCTLDAPDCAIYAIVEKTNSPVLVSTNRHVRQMAYDLVSLAWDEATGRLKGVSRVVAGDEYELRLHVPVGWRPVRAEVPGLKATMHPADDGLLLVDLVPQQTGRIAWSIRFENVP